MEKSSIKVKSVTSEIFAQNAYVVYSGSSDAALLIDPGMNPEWILEALTEIQLNLKAILITHGHADHIAGLRAIKDAFPKAIVYIGAEDANKLTDANENLSADFGFPITFPPAEKLLKDGDVFDAAGFTIQVRHIPGHSAGHVVYIIDSAGLKHIFAGDVIFRRSVGRTDFPGGDHALLLRGIREKLYSLPDDSVLYCGHGPTTTVGDEKRDNPFCSPK